MKSRATTAVVLASSFLAAACGSDGGDPQGSDSDAAGVSVTLDSVELDVADWDAVLAAADGQTVNFYMWGGSDAINQFVDTTYGPVLDEQFGITLNRVGVADTADAVNQVLAEQSADEAEGAVDMIWINGENFLSLKEADMLFGDWAEAIPNSALVDWENPAVNQDFGEPVDGYESPWSSAQFQFVYDTERTDTADLPRSYAELAEYACANPGRVTYIAPGPGAFQGTRFVKGALFELSGGAEQWADFDQELFDEWSPVLWDYLDDLKPCLWRDGENYPKDEPELHALFANDEVDFSITQAAVGAGALITEGVVPDSSKAFVFDENMIGDFNYVTIPTNASNKAAALVLANLLLDPASQAAQIDPAGGFGLGYGIDPNRVSDAAEASLLDAGSASLGDAAADPDELAAALVGDGAGEYQELVESGWRTEIAEGL